MALHNLEDRLDADEEVLAMSGEVLDRHLQGHDLGGELMRAGGRLAEVVLLGEDGDMLRLGLACDIAPLLAMLSASDPPPPGFSRGKC